MVANRMIRTTHLGGDLIFKLKSGQIGPIAIIEDDPLMAELIREMIGSYEEALEVFPLGRNFLESTHAEDFKVIILDLSLPDLDGFDLLKLLSTKSNKWRIILVSGHQNSVISAAVLYCQSMGFEVLGSLQKPFSRIELISALSSVMQENQQ